MTARVRIPADLIEGPAKIYFVMKVGEYYSPSELQELTGLAKSTTARHLNILQEAGVIEAYRGNNTRGRPSHFYRIATKENQS